MCRMTDLSVRADGVITKPGRYLVARGEISGREMYLPLGKMEPRDMWAFKGLYTIKVKARA